MRILCADDHALLRDALAQHLQILSETVEFRGVSSFNDVIRTLQSGFTPDLLLLDLHMPGMEGPNGVSRAKALLPNTPIVVVSGHIEREVVMAAIDAGARGFIPKTVSGKNMLNALRLIMSGEIYLPPLLLDEAQSPTAITKSFKRRPAFDKGLLSKLTTNELDILRLLIEGETSKEIAGVLGLTEVGAGTRIRSLYKKLGATSKADVVRIAIKGGWT